MTRQQSKHSEGVWYQLYSLIRRLNLMEYVDCGQRVWIDAVGV